MPEQIRIPVELIDPNPYQTRFEENQERISTIALSIAQDGLLQPPTVRTVDGRYQLAFGHTRSAGWKLCNWIQSGRTDGISPELIAAVENSKEDFSTMPVFPAEIEDEKMFRHAVTENAQRSDLSPIEEATAMKRAMEDFSYTSEQAGALFGKTGNTVRGKVRLLDLPEEARTKLHNGELSESAARALVTLQRVAPDQVEEAMKDILDGDDADNAVDYALRRADNIESISKSEFDVSAKTFKHLPALTLKDIPAALGIEKQQRLMNCVNQAKNIADLVQIWRTSDFESDPALAEKVEHLVKPPACTACQLYARADGTDYCAWIVCRERKLASAKVEGMQEASTRLGIAIYNPDEDGEKVLLNKYDDMHRKHVNKRHADLRLAMVTGHNNGNWTYGDEDTRLPSYVGMFAVGKLLEKVKEAKANSEADRGHVTKNASPEVVIKAVTAELNSEVVSDMLDAVLFDVFAPVLADEISIKNEAVLAVMVDYADIDNERAQELKDEKRNPAAQLKYLRQCLAVDLIERELNWNTKREALDAANPAEFIAKAFIEDKIFEKLGVAPDKSFDLAVADADVRINEARKSAIAEALAERGIDVSAETPKKKGKK